MRYFILSLITALLVACGGDTENQDETASQEGFEGFLAQYKEIPAFPFQFSLEDLHAEGNESVRVTARLPTWGPKFGQRPGIRRTVSVPDAQE